MARYEPRLLFVLTSVIGVGAFGAMSAYAQEAPFPDWEKSFVGCSAAASPYVETNILAAPRAPQPIMRIGDLQAWAITNQSGERELALTTEDGITIYGRVVGPQGEDISGSLLAAANAIDTPANGPLATLQERLDPASASSDVSAAEGSVGPATSIEPPVASDAEAAGQLVPFTAPPNGQQAATPAWAVPQPTQTEAQPAPAPEQDPMAAIQATLPPPAGSVDALLEQATEVAVWFPAASPKEGAPTVYFVADPLCPHCATATAEMAPLIEAGGIDLRVILVGITSQDAMQKAVAIIQSDEKGPGAAFLEHKRALKSSGTSPLQNLAPNEVDPNVASALVRNVLWIRENQIPGTPFFIYGTPAGAKTHMGAWDPAIIQSATALPQPPAVAPQSPPLAQAQ